MGPRTHEELMACAKADLAGIVEADAFILVVDSADLVYKGAWAELGIALASVKPVYVLGLDLHLDSQVFFHHPLVHSFEDFPG